MTKGKRWKERSWTPSVGMVIRYRQDTKLGTANPTLTAVIMSVNSFDESLTIERNMGRRRTSLSRSVWMGEWEPAPKTDGVQNKTTIPSAHVTEDDVRRIVREELAARASKVESALRLLLDELFDSIG